MKTQPNNGHELHHDRTMTVAFTQEGAIAGVRLMARLFDDGWETLEPLRHYECGHYCTTLYYPEFALQDNKPQ